MSLLRSAFTVRAFMWLSVLLMCRVALAAAGPNAAVRFLMKEPVSMLDWGFKNIEDHLVSSREAFVGDGEKIFGPDLTVYADYDWSEDVIRISVGLRLSDHVQKTPEALSEVNGKVAWIVKYLRGVLTLRPYEAFFRHKGFRNRETPQDLEAGLAAATRLIVTVRDRDSNILSMCRAPLLGEEIEWLRIGDRR